MCYDSSLCPSGTLEESKNFYKEGLASFMKFDFSLQGMIAFNMGEEPVLTIV